MDTGVDGMVFRDRENLLACFHRLISPFSLKSLTGILSSTSAHFCAYFFSHVSVVLMLYLFCVLV